MEHAHRSSILFALLITAAASFACDADVLRLNYRKAPAAKPSAKPAIALPKSADAFHNAIAPTASLTASTKLEPR
jgi:hypothetical protein